MNGSIVKHTHGMNNVGKCIVFALCCFSFSAFAQSTLTLNVGAATQKINRALYGALLENWGRDIYTGLYVGDSSKIPNTNGMRNDIISSFKDAGLSVLEWPGGCFAEAYRWKNGIGPKASRPGGDINLTSINTSNGMGTAEYFQLCSILNLIPYITCNITSADTAEMAAWLNYIDSNATWRNQLYYWKMGNEPYGGCGNGIGVTAYRAKYEKYVKAIPLKWAGRLCRIGSADNKTTYYWIDTMMRADRPLMEGISYHFYAVPLGHWNSKGPCMNFTSAQYYTQLQASYLMEGYTQSNEAVMNKYDPNYTVGLMVDEWGAWYDQIAGMGLSYQQNTVRDAIIAAMNLNIFNNHCKRVQMALVAQPVDVIQSLILTDTATSDSTGKRLIKTPTFYVFKMFKPHQNAKMVPATLKTALLDSVPTLSASASIDSTGKLHVSLENIDAVNTQTLAITLSNVTTPFKKVSGQIINGPAITSYNDYNSAELVNIEPFPAANFSLVGNMVNVSMPAHSVIMLELDTALKSNSISQSRTVLQNSDLNLIGERGGKILVTYSVKQSTPATLTLYGVDGRTVNETFAVTLQPSQNSMVWEPTNKAIGNHVYIVKVKADGFVKSQRVVFVK